MISGSLYLELEQGKCCTVNHTFRLLNALQKATATNPATPVCTELKHVECVNRRPVMAVMASLPVY
jgi:hypothetical protein